MPSLYSPLERRLALEKLDSWVGSSRHAEDRDRALGVFLSALDGAARDEDIDRGLKNDNIQVLLAGWMHADACIGRGPCAALGLLDSGKGAKLPAGSRRFLELYGMSVLGVYEVVAVDPGRSCRLRPVPDGNPVQVLESSATGQLAEGDLLGARLIRGREEQFVFEDLLLLPGDAEEAGERLEGFFTAVVAAEDDHALPDQPAFDLGSDEGAFAAAKLMAPFLARWWIEGHFGQREQEGWVPMVVNGEVYEPGMAEYALGPRAPAVERLDEIPGMEQVDPGVWNLYDRCEDRRRLVGAVYAEGIGGRYPELLLESPGRESMKSLRRAVRAVFGRTMKHVYTSYEEPRLVAPGRGSSVDTYAQQVDLEALGIDPAAPDAAERAEHAVRQQFLDRWPDESVPALGGATPRQAAGRREQRPDVIRLLRDYQAMDDARAAETGAEPLDFARIWRTLGLTEPLEGGAGGGRPPRSGPPTLTNAPGPASP